MGSTLKIELKFASRRFTLKRFSFHSCFFIFFNNKIQTLVIAIRKEANTYIRSWKCEMINASAEYHLFVVSDNEIKWNICFYWIAMGLTSKKKQLEMERNQVKAYQTGDPFGNTSNSHAMNILADFRIYTRRNFF